MTPRSDHEEDMSMEEILASIRRFVTDNPSEGVASRKSPVEMMGEPATEPYEDERVKQHERQEQGVPPVAFSPPPAQRMPDVLDLTRSFPLREEVFNRERLSGEKLVRERAESSGSSPLPLWESPINARASRKEESILTLTNPLPVRGEEKSAYAPNTSALDEGKEDLSSSHTVAASANSLSRLAQTATLLSAQKTASRISAQRNMTLDQLIQDMIRPVIKQWIDTHLPSLVEEMVEKEIKRITDHLSLK